MAERLNEHRIYVGGLDPRIDLKLFEDILSVLGEVWNVSFNEREGFGCVSYGHKKEARSAIKYLHGICIFGSPIRVEWASGWPREDLVESATERLLASLRRQPELRRFRSKDRLMSAVLVQMKRGNPRVLRILSQDWTLFGPLYLDPREEGDRLPPLVVAGTSPLERAPSTSVTPRISQLQSEPHIPHNGLAIASVPASVEPNGATNANETEVRRSKRLKHQEDQKSKKTKVNKEVEETKTVCRLQCKICLDVEVGVVFVPCGHLVSCPTCAERIFDCPICRKQITSKVRTYI